MNIGVNFGEEDGRVPNILFPIFNLFLLHGQDIRE